MLEFFFLHCIRDSFLMKSWTRLCQMFNFFCVNSISNQQLTCMFIVFNNKISKVLNNLGIPTTRNFTHIFQNVVNLFVWIKLIFFFLQFPFFIWFIPLVDMIGIKPAPGDHESNFKKVGTKPSELLSIILLKYDVLKDKHCYKKHFNG